MKPPIRLYFPEKLSQGQSLVLPREMSHRLLNVLRVGAGQPLCLFNGHGGQYAAHVAAVESRRVTVAVDAWESIERESPLALRLYQAVSTREKIEWIIQKATGLGTSSMTLVTTERSEAPGKRAAWTRRLTHFQQVIVSACEQCGRNRLAVLNGPVTLEACLEESRQVETALFFDPHASLSFSGFMSSHSTAPKSAALFIGPEGGLSAEEGEALQKHGWHALRLGPRILRMETAAIAALAALNSHWGDF